MQTKRNKRKGLADDATPKRKASANEARGKASADEARGKASAQAAQARETEGSRVRNGAQKGRRDFVMKRWLTRISVEMEIDQLYATL